MRLSRIPSIGVLGFSQIVCVGISVAGFAILARTIGPTPFAVFASISFAFTLIALATDLSPQGFLLVRGYTLDARRSARQIATLSAGFGSVVVLAVVYFCVPLALKVDVSITAAVVTGAAVALQFLSQNLRAPLLEIRAYSSIAVSDIVAYLTSVAVAIGLSQLWPTVETLCTQLLVLVMVRNAVMVVRHVQLRRLLQPSVSEDPAADSFRAAVSYGSRVLPLNVSSYASRSLDSGVLPAILSLQAAATYSRSFQLVVAPLTQLQLAVGGAAVARLAEAKRSGDFKLLSRRIWRMVCLFSSCASTLICLLSPVISRVFFGPTWLNPGAFISAMSCLLPGFFVVTFCAWHLQVGAVLRRSVAQLLIGLIVPLSAIAGALTFGPQGALLGLVGASLFVPLLVLGVQYSMLPPFTTRKGLQAQFVGAWALPAIAFVSTSVFFSDFWRIQWTQMTH